MLKTILVAIAFLGVAILLLGVKIFFTKDGYIQSGWSTTEDGELEYNFGDYYTANSDITLYPVWKECNLTVGTNGEYDTIASALKDASTTCTLKLVSNVEENDVASIKENYSINVSADKTTIEPDEIATITASISKANKKLHYQVKNGTTLMYEDDVVTNNNGQASITYTGTGAGEIDIISTYFDIEKTITIQDGSGKIQTIIAAPKTGLNKKLN